MERMEGANTHAVSGDRLVVSRADDAVLIQVIGLGNMFLAPTLQSFVESELNAGFLNFVINLGDCQGMDSTFMGTFIGLSAEVRRRFGWFCLVNVSDENKRLLRMLGILNLVSIHDNDFPVAEGKSTVLYPTQDPYSRQKQIHSAHRMLIQADPQNVQRFGPFIKALEAEMAEVPTIIPPSRPDTEPSADRDE